MHIGIVLAIGLCIVIGIPAFLIFLLAPRLSGRKRVHPFLGVKWAHRGLHDKKRGIPENSFPAFRAAIEAGDERICGRRGRVEDTSYEEMQKYRLAETKERIPLLSEVLQLVDGKVPLLIEVKLPNTDTKICRKLDEELRKYHGEYMIQSFNSLVLRWMKKHRNEIPRGQLSENLTKNDRTTHYLLRFCVKYLLSNCMCRPDFISYRWSDRKNPGLWLNRVLFKTPAAAWTLHGEKDVKAARRSFDMYIFEMS